LTENERFHEEVQQVKEEAKLTNKRTTQLEWGWCDNNSPWWWIDNIVMLQAVWVKSTTIMLKSMIPNPFL